jgi:hypothetical protein
MAGGMGAIAIRVASINVPATTPDDLRIKAYFARTAQWCQRIVQESALMMDELVAGSSSVLDSASRNCAQLLKLGGAVLSLLQISLAYAEGGADEAAKKAAGAMGGLALAGVGATAGTVVGGLAATAATMLGVAVSTTVAASIGAVLGAAAVGYFAGKAFEEAYAPYIRPALDELFEIGGTAWQQAQTFYTESLARLGKLDGTWLESLNATDEQKAALTTLLAGATGLPVSDKMNADIKRLLEAPFDGSSLVSRDTLLTAVLSIAKDQNAYISERVTVSEGAAAMNLPPLASVAQQKLRDLIGELLDPADNVDLRFTAQTE